MRTFFAFFIAALSLVAANFKLYLKDGGYQIVKEYRVEGDRIKYYSVERSDWEEMPAALVDLKRTETEAAAKKATLDRQAKEISEEDAAAQELMKEIMKIPRDPGVYMLENDQLRIFKLADASVHTNKGRSVLKAISPVPLVSGKAALEVNGDHSENILKENRPEFYLQLSSQNSFAIVKLTPHNGVRIVERITVEPVVKEVAEERDSVPIFTKQLTESGLYKIWPQEPLARGDYAVFEYKEGKLDVRIWDFRIQ
ncbi:MAG TPA: hypothetical protein VHB50_15475 [Bryobacteraceae bacterium]|nr:hypothetical protein [Bryobacteraceae bacterium]